MSRIVRGPSEAVRRMTPVRSAERGAHDFRSATFHSLVAEGSISEEELEQQKILARREGAKEAEIKLLASVQGVVQHLERIVDELSQFRRDLFKEAESEIMQLIYVICRKVVGKELSLKPELLQEIVGKALMSLEREKKVILQFNPQDLEWIRKARPDFLEKVKGLEEISFDIDSSLEPGHILAKTKRVELDLSSEAIVDHIVQQMQLAREEIKQTNDEGDTIL